MGCRRSTAANYRRSRRLAAAISTPSAAVRDTESGGDISGTGAGLSLSASAGAPRRLQTATPAATSIDGKASPPRLGPATDRAFAAVPSAPTSRGEVAHGASMPKFVISSVTLLARR